ncbi:MAG: DUF882 domain-containing protein [Alphaproteobacteria bacterium]
MASLMLAVVFMLSTFAQVTALPGERSLTFFNIHTKERATIVYKRGNRYASDGLRKINNFLRDWRRDEPTKMDPALLDLVWEVYRRAGARQGIHVVSGYRSPTTNSRLRRRSKGVAKNSMHMRGQAIDFYMPGVKLATLRELGLKFEVGGVGYYPRSGAPFVHLDTGSVRHWPRMSRKQLARVFPNGKTMHIPSDGKPLAGYALAKAEYQTRKSRRNITVASLAPAAPRRAQPAQVVQPVNDPLIIASAPAQLPPAIRAVGVAIANYDTSPAPLPRLSSRRARIGSATALAPARRATPDPLAGGIASRQLVEPVRLAQDFDFGKPRDWAAPVVPANLAAAMAERDQSRRNASLPIPPTSVVAIINVNRPLRAETITTAVIRNGIRQTIPLVLAYAPPSGFAEIAGNSLTTGAIGGVPQPRVNPVRQVGVTRSATRSVIPARNFTPPKLILTTLDTHGLRSWIGAGSTRQRAFATLTMPDIRRRSDVAEIPQFSLARGFGKYAYPDLRTDRFSGPLVRQPAIIMLATH